MYLPKTQHQRLSTKITNFLQKIHTSYTLFPGAMSIEYRKYSGTNIVEQTPIAIPIKLAHIGYLQSPRLAKLYCIIEQVNSIRITLGVMYFQQIFNQGLILYRMIILRKSLAFVQHFIETFDRLFYIATGFSSTLIFLFTFQFYQKGMDELFSLFTLKIIKSYIKCQFG